jgi:hypothetical protein
MSPSDESYLFDATNYPDFERAKALKTRLQRSDLLWFRGLGTVVIFVAVLVWFLLSGAAAEQPIVFGLIVAMGVIICATLFLAQRDSPDVPVRIAADRQLVIGDRRWSVDGIGSIVAYGARGAVDVKDKRGRTMSMPYRVQFGSFDDFLVVMRRLRPDLEIARETTNVKVKVPQDD